MQKQTADKRVIPKDKGCFQCSRRRIVCDKGEPACRKCLKKGIECSGLQRIRFTEGFLGRSKGRSTSIDPNQCRTVAQSSDHAGVKIRWKSDKKVKKRERFEMQSDPNTGTNRSQSHAQDALAGNELSPQIDEPEPSGRQDLADTTVPTVRPWIPLLSSEARMLFGYFSNVVAPAMVVLDTLPNGYREFILPMAVEDDILRRAVGVVAAQRLSHERPDLRGTAETSRAALISRLRRESLCGSADRVFSKFTWATLIVLLVGETVTGNADYTFLANMLISLSVNSKAKNENSEVVKFLQAQTNMFTLLGSPLLGEDKGLLAITGLFQTWPDFLSYKELPVASDDRQVMENVRQSFACACSIYIHRVTSRDPGLDAISLVADDVAQYDRIQMLVQHLSQIPPEAPGAHAFVWVCFVAAAESNDLLQRAFFVDYMCNIYARTGFENIPGAIQILHRIWEGKLNRRWTQCLPDLSKVLIIVPENSTVGAFRDSNTHDSDFLTPEKKHAKGAIDAEYAQYQSTMRLAAQIWFASWNKNSEAIPFHARYLPAADKANDVDEDKRGELAQTGITVLGENCEKAYRIASERRQNA